MSIIRRLIFFEWLKSFLAALIVLLLIFTLATLISGSLSPNFTLLEVMKAHFIDLPLSLIRITPVSCLIATLFSVNKLKNRNELTAIFASGFSRFDYIVTILQGSLLVAIALFLTLSYVDPWLKENRLDILGETSKRVKSLKEKGLKASTMKTGRIWYKSHDYFFGFTSYNKREEIITNVSYYKYDETQKLSQLYLAKSAHYLAPQKSWQFHQVLEYSGLNTLTYPLVTKHKNLMIKLKESPSNFQEIESDITTLDVLSLYHYIKKLEESGININEYKVLFYNKIAVPLLCMIFSLISSISIFSPNRRGSSFGANLFAVLSFAIFFWLINSYALELGNSGRVTAFLAVFFVPLLFIGFLATIFFKHRKLA